MNARTSVAVLVISIVSLQTSRSVAEVKILHHFSGNVRRPEVRLVPYESDLIGVTPSAIFRIGQDGSGFETLRTFTSSVDTSPVGITVSGPHLFGMVERLASPDIDKSAVFRFSPIDNTYNRIHVFEGQGSKRGTLLSASGSTLFGAITQRNSTNSTSTLFKLNSDGSGYQPLHEFVLPGLSRLDAPIVNGDYVFGTNTFSNPAAPSTLYRIRTDGSAFETIHTFNNAAGEGYFVGDFAIGGSTIYGAVSGGFQTQLGTVPGSIYKLAVDGSSFEVLRDFSNGEGAGSLVLDGTKLYGVAHSAAPAIFQMNTDGTGYQVLHDFGLDSNSSFGVLTLMLHDGQLFGTTAGGGQNNMGTIFAIPIPEPSSIVLGLLAIVLFLLTTMPRIAVRRSKR